MEKEIILTNRVPTLEDLQSKFQDINELGIYLHIPFCHQICPYCPYNKELFDPGVARSYTQAIIKEIDHYGKIIGDHQVTSFYIGGGTPTTMLNHGMEEILNHVYKVFNMKCGIHMESHPNDLGEENLNTLESLGVQYLSIGVESLQDHHLQTLCRSYTVKEVKETVARVVRRNFKCVNLDFIFALPNQTYREIEEAGKALVGMGIDQVATYPLFHFPYTRFGKEIVSHAPGIPTLLKRRRMLLILEDIFYEAGFDRSSVWAFTKQGVDKYCSVTVPLYLGLGASGGTYLNDIFYINTFHVAEYIKSFENGSMPVALSLDLTNPMQMAGWLYWRIYETQFRKNDFFNRFGSDFDQQYGKYMKWLSRIGFLKDDGSQIRLTNKGSYWLHAFEDVFSIDYISKLWGTSSSDPWPDRVFLM